MKKKILLVVVLALVSGLLFAAPFGLRMGMDLGEIASACDGRYPERFDNDCYRIYPKKSHPLFRYYYVYVDESKGLYRIEAKSDDIKSNNYGKELQDSFNEIKNRISKTYGLPVVIERIDNSSIWRDDSYWLIAVEEGARSLYASWNEDLKDDLKSIYIYVSAKGYQEKGWVNLEYRFTNADAVEDSQDDVF